MSLDKKEYATVIVMDILLIFLIIYLPWSGIDNSHMLPMFESYVTFWLKSIYFELEITVIAAYGIFFAFVTKLNCKR